MSGPQRTDSAPEAAATGSGELLFGRDQDLSALRRSLEAAAAGDPAVVVVRGETGVGKSSLLAAALRGGAATVLSGSCVPLLGQDMPFAPVVQALRDVARRGADPRGRAPGPPAELQRLIADGGPEPGGRPGTGTPQGDRGLPLSGAGQVRLFEAVLRLLGDLGQSAAVGAGASPVVLLLEDVHWADRSTLDLVAFLARNLSTERVLVALTVRSDGLERGDRFTGWLAELDRLPRCRTVHLDRLARDATAAQLAALLGRPPEPRVLDLLHDHAAGNPLFTELLLPWADDPTRPLPTTLRELLGSRFAALPGRTRRVLEVASVLGRAVGLDLLAAVVGAPEDDVEQALRPAVDRQLVDPGPGTGYSFHHPLFREVLAAELLPGDRRRLHAGAARALSDAGTAHPEPPFTRAAEVARHWESAAEPQLAFQAAVVAGLAASEVAAYREADQLLDRAVRLWRRPDAPLPATAFGALSLDEPGLLAQAAQAAHLVGDDARAVDLAEQAAERCADPAGRAQVLERLGAYCFETGRPQRADTAYRAALDLLPGSAATPARARICAGMALLAMGWSRLDDARSWSALALDAARATGERSAEGRALNVQGVVAAFAGDVDPGVASLRRSLRIAEELSEPDDLALACIDLSYVLVVVGRYDEAAEVARSGLAALHRVGGAALKADFLRANAADALMRGGRWDEAEQLVSASPDRPRGMLDFPIVQTRARLAIGRGDLAGAGGWVDALQEIVQEHEVPEAWRRELAETEAELALWRGRPDVALRISEAALDAIASGDERRFTASLGWLRVRALADVAEQAAARRDDRELAAARGRGEELARSGGGPWRPAGSGSEREDVAGPRGAGPAESGSEPEDAPGLRRTATPEAAESGSEPEDARGLRRTTTAEAAEWPEDAALAATTRAELLRLAGSDAVAAWRIAVRRWAVLGPGLPLGYARWREAEATVAARGSFELAVRSVRAAAAAAWALRAQALVAEVTQLARVARVDLLVEPPELGVGRRAADVPGPVGPPSRAPASAPAPAPAPAHGSGSGPAPQPVSPSQFQPVSQPASRSPVRPRSASRARPEVGPPAPAAVSPTASTRSVPEPRQRVGGTGEVDGAAPATPAAAAARRLTPREREVLASLVAGRTNGEIARAMYISVKTASVHVSNILRKLDVPNREQAARLGYRLGVVPAADPERPEDDQP